MDNLDIYNSINADTDQGTSFLDYKKHYAKATGNSHDLLSVSSSPDVGSIIEAIDGTDSISSYNSATQRSLTANQTAFNTLLSQYTLVYNSYVSSNYMQNVNSGITLSATDSSNNLAIKANLQVLNSQLLALATTIVSEINSLKTTNGTLRQEIQEQEKSLIRYMNQLSDQQNTLEQPYYDNDSVDGAIETASLSMNSYFMQYLVYFFITVTLIVFLVNITINPKADMMKSALLLVALFAVYIISRWVNK